MSAQIPPQMQTTTITMDELNRQYGEAVFQFKIANNKVMMLEQQFQQIMNQGGPQTTMVPQFVK